MNRLTCKTAIGYCDTNIATRENKLNKLGQLEDIEEELGIDLITLFKAKNGFYGDLFQKYYLDADNYSIIKTIYKYKNQIKVDFLDKKIEAYFDYEEYYMYFNFCDYGKTWALTRKELKK